MANDTKNEKTTRVSAKQKLQNQKDTLSKLTLGDVFNDEELTRLINKAESMRDLSEKEIIKIGVEAICSGNLPIRPITTTHYIIDYLALKSK